MRLILRLLIFAGLAWLTFWLLKQAQGVNAEAEVDATKVVLLFGGVVLVGGVAGILFVVLVMPAIGDFIGNFFFQPNEQIEKGPHADAQGASARGDHAGAVEAYRKVLADNPEDTLAYSEIAKISCEHLDDAAGAQQLLEESLQREWLPEDAAFLSGRLVDVYWKYQQDFRSARALLLQVIEAMPNTRQSANAQHRLKDLEYDIAQHG